MNYGTPALLFGAIALIMLAYTNRFVVLAKLIRDIHADANDANSDLNKRQVDTLRLRLSLVKGMQTLGVFSFLVCSLSMFSLFIDAPIIGKYLFGLAIICLMSSLVLSLWEVLISTKALDMVLNDFHEREE